MGGGLQRIQRGYKSHPHELPSIWNIGHIHELPESKHHAYTMNNRLKHSKETRKPKEQYKHVTYLNQKLITREISDARLTSTKVQAVERALIGWHLL